KHIDNTVYPESATTRDNLKLFAVPKKGEILEVKKEEILFSGSKVTDQNIARLYAFLIVREMGIAKPMKDGYYIDGVRVEDLTLPQLCAAILGKIKDTSSFQHKINEDYYFMMGDNRDNSADSRFWGFVPREKLIGRPILVWMPLDRFGLPPK
ncbi:MAG: signal peptidase I, partial [Candidatus Firestonebacteria bacterium GWA2_43_8]